MVATHTPASATIGISQASTVQERSIAAGTPVGEGTVDCNRIAHCTRGSWGHSTGSGCIAGCSRIAKVHHSGLLEASCTGRGVRSSYSSEGSPSKAVG